MAHFQILTPSLPVLQHLFDPKDDAVWGEWCAVVKRYQHDLEHVLNDSRSKMGFRARALVMILTPLDMCPPALRLKLERFGDENRSLYTILEKAALPKPLLYLAAAVSLELAEAIECEMRGVVPERSPAQIVNPMLNQKISEGLSLPTWMGEIHWCMQFLLGRFGVKDPVAARLFEAIQRSPVPHNLSREEAVDDHWKRLVVAEIHRIISEAPPGELQEGALRSYANYLSHPTDFTEDGWWFVFQALNGDVSKAIRFGDTSYAEWRCRCAFEGVSAGREELLRFFAYNWVFGSNEELSNDSLNKERVPTATKLIEMFSQEKELCDRLRERLEAGKRKVAAGEAADARARELSALLRK